MLWSIQETKVVPVISNIRAAVPHWPLFLFLFHEINVKNTACVTEKPLDVLIWHLNIGLLTQHEAETEKSIM